MLHRYEEFIFHFDGAGHICFDPAGADANCTDSRGVVCCGEFAGESFVESEGGGFSAGIVDCQGSCYEGGAGGDGNNSAVVGASHGRDELTDCAEVGEDVDAKGLLDRGLVGVEKHRAIAYAGIVD